MIHSIYFELNLDYHSLNYYLLNLKQEYNLHILIIHHNFEYYC